MNQGVQISVEEHQYRQHPQGALSAEMKERKTGKPQTNLVQEHLMQKHRAVWKFQQQQHEWLKERLLEISQLPTVLDTPQFPTWVFDDWTTEEEKEEEEEEKEEEEEENKKKKAGKRKREDEKKRKGKKKMTEEIEELEETEEETETEEIMKDMEREEEEESEETSSEHDSELDLTMEEMLRRKSTEKTQPQQPPQSPPQQNPPQQNSPQQTPQKQPPQKQPNQETTQTAPYPKQAEPVVFTNPNVFKEKLQVIEEEPEEGSITGAGGSGIPKADATASGAVAPTAAASQQLSKEQAESTLQVELQELEKRKRVKAATTLQGIAEASGILQKTPTTSEAVKSTTGEMAGESISESVKEGSQEKGEPEERAMEDPKNNQPPITEAAETERQPEEVAAQSSAVAPGATAPKESTGATAPPAAATTRPPKLQVKRAATRASTRLRSGAKPK